jgi:multidrug resistance efflux pump
MSKGRLILVNLIGIIVLCAVLGGGAYFYYQNANYVTTDDAKVSADMTQIVSPATGKLTGWDVMDGKTVSKGNELGKVTDGKETVSIKSAMGGTIIKHGVNNEQLVQAGQLLAQAADLDHLFITANIEETDLSDIEVGDTVDITVDGDANTSFEGKVEEIGYATNSVFSMLPQQNTSNYTKVTQKVPVKISITNPSEKVLPGMNAEIKISL